MGADGSPIIWRMPQRWKPNVTVAAVIERQGRFLLVEEHTAEGLRLNTPAGHLDPGESLPAACRREVLEETAYDFEPTALVGIYLQRSAPDAPQDITYLRFCFCGALGAHHAAQPLDQGIVRALWLSPQEIRTSRALHRSALVQQSIDDYLAGQRGALDLLHAQVHHPNGGGQ